MSSMSSASSSGLNAPMHTAQGLAAMLVACFLFSLMGMAVYLTGQSHPEVSVGVISFIRMLVNTLVILIPAMLSGSVRTLLGDLGLALWMRGFYGTLALMLSFWSIHRIGPGEAGFLGASSGVFMALLAPFYLRQKNSPLIWPALTGSFLGLYLLLQPDQGAISDIWGRLAGLASGLLGAMAYLMVARAGQTNPASTVIFYFCLMAIPLHGMLFLYERPIWPSDWTSWSLLIACGAAASGAQYFMTRAYQTAPAALVSAVGYVTPVFSLALTAAWLAIVPSPKALVGCALIGFCGVCLPFISSRPLSSPKVPPVLPGKRHAKKRRKK